MVAKNEQAELTDNVTEFPRAKVLTAHYTTDADAGTITLVLEGRTEIVISETLIDGEIKFTSKAFKVPQADLKSALTSAAKNVTNALVVAEYDAQNPKVVEAKGTRVSKAAKLEGYAAALEANAKALAEENAETRAVMNAIMAKLGITADQLG